MAAMNVECSDYLEFQDTLRKMRQMDDKIIYLLNTTIPTESFKGQVDATSQCRDLYDQIHSGHAQRQVAITNCLNISKQRVKELKSRRDNGEETPTLVKTLRKEQSTMRSLESELGVEDIVRKRTTQVYYERCRAFYKPPNVQT